jgi:hypothetical protein
VIFAKWKPATVVVALKEKLRVGVESLLASSGSATNYDACLGLAFDALKAATRRTLHQINVAVRSQYYSYFAACAAAASWWRGRGPSRSPNAAEWAS